MTTSPRVGEVAAEKVMLIEERSEGYRRDLVLCLVEVIQAQQEGLSDKGRRERVGKIVEALGGKVAAQEGES